ncbi:MAG TPA: DUF2894 domain-containing protein, partial [Lysobacter sp.]|nr:DUF2894 domain-containing protein [Lysobacter sp.]
DPLRFARIEALARRAAQQHDGLRRVLDARVLALAADCAAGLDDVRSRDPRTPVAAARDASVTAALASLLDRLDARGAVPDLAPLDALRRASAQARAHSQVRLALEQAPQDAGPLNSARLVHRALLSMRDASPDYLQAFMGYVDTLAWLDGLAIGDGAGTSSSASGTRRTRPKPRARRG